MRLLGSIISFCVISLASASAFAGPFGLFEGMPLSQLKIKSKIGESNYEIVVPTPNNEFESYIVVATPEHGLCKVLAIGKSYDNDRYGSNVKETYSELKSFLISKYGSAKEYDFIKHGALWSEQNEWVMSIKQNERSFVAFWSLEHSGNMPDAIGGIQLKVSASSSDSAYITLGYEFKNIDKCLLSIKARKNQSL